MKLRKECILLWVALGALVGYREVRGELITTLGLAFVEDFDSLASSGTSNGVATLPGDWTFQELGSGGNTLYAANNGSSSTGNTYSYGTVGSGERALGAVASSSVQSVFGSSFTNGTDAKITELLLEFVGEQWRAANLNAQHFDFQYSLDATGLLGGTWFDVDALDIVSVINSATGAINGNLPENRRSYSAVLSGLSLEQGESLWIRWQDSDDAGADHGLALDDFMLTARGEPIQPPDPDPGPGRVVPEPGSLVLALWAVPGLFGYVWNRRRRGASQGYEP